MGFRLAVAAAAGLAAVAVLAVDSPQASGQASVGDSVTGTALAGSGFTSARFDAHSGPSGENPSGTITLVQPPIVSPVTCLAVSGNRATIGIDIGGLGRAGLLYFVEDNDGAGSDGLSFSGTAAPPRDCAQPLPPGYLTVAAGDIVVTDTSPLPSSKDECKNGGWRNFPGFKNQGDCVAFINHQARQECIFIRAYDRLAFRARYGTPLTGRHAMRRCVRQRSDD